ncbi:MAG: argininosuccinate lyase [Candidatus Binatia bacterium]
MLKQKSGAYRGFRTAGIRLAEELSPLIPRIPLEDGILQGYHALDKAHIVMLAEEGLLERPQAAAMLQALREMEAEGVEGVRREMGGMHSGEQYLIRRLGEEVGGRMHLGRSSGDLGSVAWRWRSREGLLAVLEASNELRATILEIAGEHTLTVMPTYTHGKHAQITTLGHTYAGWAAGLERSVQRLLDCYQMNNVSTAGASAGTSTSFTLNRQRIADLLGFDSVSKNARDQYSPDNLLHQLAALAILLSEVAQWCDDILFWGADEMGMVDLADRFCGTSSIMTQKKNFNAVEVPKAIAGRVIMGLGEAFIHFKGSTMLGVLERSYAAAELWHAFDDTVTVLRLMEEVLRTLQINRERMRTQAGSHWAQATDVAAELVKEKGLPWRTAHQIIGIAVRLAYERRLRAQEVTPAFIDEAAIEYQGAPLGLSETALRRALDPEEFVRSRTLIGGTAPEEVQRQRRLFLEHLEKDRSTVGELRSRQQAAAAGLEAAIDQLIASV